MHQAIGEVVAAGPKSRHKTGTPVMYMQYGAFSDFKVALYGLSGLSLPALDTNESDFWDENLNFPISIQLILDIFCNYFMTPHSYHLSNLNEVSQSIVGEDKNNRKSIKVWLMVQIFR